MKKQIKIGSKVFTYKKEVLLYFKNILNSYKYGETLNLSDFNDVFSLLKFHKKAKEKIGSGIVKIKVDKMRYKTKCFRLIRSDSSTDVFSYIRCINGSYSPITKFSRTCRELVRDDLRNVKLAYFKKESKKGRVKCQETDDICLWEELNVDHRQPNTFSVIVDRFIEVYQIDLSSVRYIEKIDGVYSFVDNNLSEKFRRYHKDKATLRLVKKGKNLGRSYQARIKRQKKDLIINENNTN